MTAEQKKNVDVKALSNFMRLSLCVIAVIMIVSYFVMVARSVNEKAVSVVSTMLIPIIGSISVSYTHLDVYKRQVLIFHKNIPEFQ